MKFKRDRTIKRKIYTMKRKIYNADNPTPSPECPKLIDSYNETCKNYNDKVKEYKNKVKNNVKDCKENIIKWEDEKKNLQKKINDIQKAFDAAALEFATNMQYTQKFKEMTNKSNNVRFFNGYFDKPSPSFNNVQIVGKPLNDKSPGILEQANCYINYIYTSDRFGKKIYQLKPPREIAYSSSNAAKAIAVLVDLRQTNGQLPKTDAGNEQGDKNRFQSETKLMEFGFVNDIVKDVKRGPDGNFILEINGDPIVKEREHNGRQVLGKKPDGTPYFIVDNGGFKLIREFTNDFVNSKKYGGNNGVIEKLKQIPGIKQEIEKLDGNIEECNSYIKDDPNNNRRIEEKRIIENFIKDFKEALNNKMKAIKDKGCTAPKKCDEPKLIR